ncbi:MAG: hypothetical protein JWN40_5157 [Phycisphaerales bacterium]|nr:hypothetical protein [Phycisphaerales bacterium]
MPIRVECPGCHDVTHFADNDAGLAVACLACGRHLRVPKKSAPVAKTVARTLIDQDPPLALPDDRPTAATPVQAPTSPRRPVQPARPKGRWRTYMLLVVLLSCAGTAIALVVKNRASHSITPLAQNNGTPTTTVTPPATQRTTLKIAATFPTTSPAPVTVAAATQPLPSSRPAPAPAVARHYTPDTAPVGFIGFDRVEITGHIEVDSYDAAIGRVGAGATHAAAPLLSNGPIQLTGDGEIRGSVRSAGTTPVKASKHLHISGPISPPLPARVPAPPVTLDPFAHDSANAALPNEFYKNGNLNLYGAHQIAIPAGVYYLNDLNIDSPATLRLQGPVTLLVSGRLSIGGNIDTHDNRPADCRIRVTGDKPVTIANKNTLFLDLYAPQSPIDITGKGHLYGSIVGKTLRITGTRPLHFDESLVVHPN